MFVWVICKEAELPFFQFWAHLINPILFLYYVFYVILVVFHFCFGGETVVLFKIVPGSSLLLFSNLLVPHQFSAAIVCSLYIRRGKV